ncbi:hypothetical protein [Sinorhizobium fredii]|uniref:hypothetical protein n=1 Tax=Rhizobium fredii TaxID=380 RepID=UPI003511FD90
MSKLLFDHHPDDLPETYVMTGDGHCLEPEIGHGQKLMFSRTERYKPGDFVAIFKRREFTASGDHQVIIKKLLIAPRAEYWTDPANFRCGNVGAIVIAQMLNPGRVLHFDPAALLGIHKCLGPVPEGHTTFKVDDQWIRQQARAMQQNRALEPC